MFKNFYIFTFVTLFKTGAIFAILKQDKTTFSLKNE